MGSKTNRSLAAKADKHKRQVRALAEAEYFKPAYFPRSIHHTKSALRELAASAQHMVKAIDVATKSARVPDDFEIVMVPYMPKRPVRHVTPAQRAYVNCGDELIKIGRRQTENGHA